MQNANYILLWSNSSPAKKNPFYANSILDVAHEKS